MKNENITYDDYFEKYREPTDPPKVKDEFSKYRDNSNIGNGRMQGIANATSTSLLGVNTGFGDSKYDKEINWGSDVDMSDIQGSLNENRAEQQSGWAIAGAGLARVGTKALTEVAKIPGYVGGIAMAGFADEGQGWDIAMNNKWNQTLSKWNEDVNTELLPVYAKKAVTEGDFMTQIMSHTFWAVEGADGAGFLFSMFLPGMALKSLGIGHKLLGTTAKGLAYANAEKGLAGSVRLLESAGITAKNIDLGIMTLANTGIESMAEGGAAMDSFQKDLDRRKNLQPGELGYIDENQYQDLMLQKGKLGRDVFLSNLAILLVPNAIQTNMIWGKGVGSKLVKDTPSLMGKVGNRGMNLLGATASEGFLEEGTQSTVETMFTDKANKGELGDSFLKDFNVSELVSSYIEMLNTTDGQKAIFLGGVLGGGMSMYQGAKSDIATRKQTADVLDLAERKVGAFNTINNTDVYKRNKDGNIEFNPNNTPTYDPVKVVNFAKSLEMTESQGKQFEAAVAESNEKGVQQLKNIAISQLINPFINSGELGLQALEQHLNDTLSTEELKDNKDAESLKADIIERATYMQDQLNSYKEFSKTLISLNNENATPEETQDFLDKIGSVYINLKGIEHAERKELKKLKSEKAKLLKDLGRDQMILTDEVVDENAVEDMYKFKSIQDPRIKLIDDQIFASENELKDIDKIVNDLVWDNNKLNESFNNTISEDTKLKEEADIKAKEIDALIEKVNDLAITEESQLNDLIKNNSGLAKDPIVNKKIQEKRQEIINRKKAEEAARKQAEHEAAVAAQAQQPTAGTATNTVNNENSGLSPGTESIQSNETEEAGEFGEFIVTDPTEFELIPDNTKTQPGARVISTYKDTGETIPGLELFVEYEQTPRDKTKDKVTFELGDVNSQSQNIKYKELVDKIKRGEELTPEEIKHLEDFMPIKITLSNEGNSASSFLDSMTHSEKAIVEVETLPLRKAIVKALIDNKGSFEGIEGKVEKQFPGRLKISENNKNDVFDLYVFKGMNESEKIAYFKDNTGYTNTKGDFMSAKTGEIIEGPQFVKSDPSRHKGELFLNIQMNNGKPFWLKLNTNNISEEKANSLYDLMLVKFELTDEASLSDLEQYLVDTNRTELLFSIQDEINLIKSNEPLRTGMSVNKLIDLLIHNGNKNSKTKFTIDFDGSEVEVGTLFGKLNETEGIHSITKEEFNANPELYREGFVKFFKYKRHNVLFNHSSTANFQNSNYIKYLLNPKNPIISTNAVVNEGTFGGYSNIYLNQNVTNSNNSNNTSKEYKPKTTVNSTINGMTTIVDENNLGYFNEAEEIQVLTNRNSNSFIIDKNKIKMRIPSADFVGRAGGGTFITVNKPESFNKELFEKEFLKLEHDGFKTTEQSVNKIVKEVKNLLSKSSEVKTETANTAEIDALEGQSKGSEAVAEVKTVEVTETNRDSLIKDLKDLKDSNPREYMTRVSSIIKNSNGELIMRDIKESIEYIIDKLIESKTPIEGKIIKKDC